MKTINIIQGLTILEKYRNDDYGYNTSAEHDVLYAYATDTPLSEEDIEQMIKLGWVQEDVDTGEDDFSVKYYDPKEIWSCCV